MSIKAKLFFKKEERILLETDVNYERFIAWNGKPTTDLLDGTIKVSFEPQMYDDLFIESLLENRLDKKNSKDLSCYQKLYKPHDGKIVFYEDNDYEIELFQYNFKDAVIIELYEEFDSQIGMLVSMVISPAMQDYRFRGNTTKWNELSPTRFIKHSWQESYIKPINEKVVITRDTRKITSFTITDKNGKNKEKIKVGEIIYLNIKSTNKVGDLIDIVITNKERDFKYKGELLQDDTLKDYTIQSNHDILKFEVVQEQK